MSNNKKIEMFRNSEPTYGAKSKYVKATYSVNNDAITINASFGSNITYSPSFPKWIKIKDGIYNSMNITLTDQNFNTIYARDPNLIITLMIRQRSIIE